MKNNNPILDEVMREFEEKFSWAGFYIVDGNGKNNNELWVDIISWIEQAITKAVEERDGEWLKAVSDQNPVFVRNDIVSLVSQDRDFRIRDVIRVEILEKMGMDASKIRKRIKKSLENNHE